MNAINLTREADLRVALAVVKRRFKRYQRKVNIEVAAQHAAKVNEAQTYCAENFVEEFLRFSSIRRT